MKKIENCIKHDARTPNYNMQQFKQMPEICKPYPKLYEEQLNFKPPHLVCKYFFSQYLILFNDVFRFIQVPRYLDHHIVILT